MVVFCCLCDDFWNSQLIPHYCSQCPSQWSVFTNLFLCLLQWLVPVSLCSVALWSPLQDTLPSPVLWKVKDELFILWASVRSWLYSWKVSDIECTEGCGCDSGVGVNLPLNLLHKPDVVGQVCDPSTGEVETGVQAHPREFKTGLDHMTRWGWGLTLL